MSKPLRASVLLILFQALALWAVSSAQAIEPSYSKTWTMTINIIPRDRINIICADITGKSRRGGCVRWQGSVVEMWVPPLMTWRDACTWAEEIGHPIFGSGHTWIPAGC